MDPQEESSESVPDSDGGIPARLDRTASSRLPRRRRDARGRARVPDVEEGVSEAEHDQMRQASRQTRTATTRAIKGYGSCAN